MEHEQAAAAIDLAADGALGAGERRALDEHLAGCADCARAMAEAVAVTGKLAGARLAVRPGFAADVMAALEPAPWEARTARSWRLPLAVLVAVGGAAAALLGSGAAAFAPSGGTAGALFALADLFRASLVAGSGLAAASWRAVGDAAGTWLGDSPANWLAAAVLALGANYLLFRLLRASRQVEATSTTTSRRP
jgi:anti-sigma factor RsiW